MLNFKQSCFAIAASALLAAQPVSAVAQDLPTVVVVATGGTIAMTVDPETGAPVPALAGEDIVAAVPGLEDLAEIEVIEFANIPSTYLNPERWRDLAQTVEEALADENVAGAIVTHGTDVLEETAFFLDLTLESDKPVVLIGALRSATDWDADGPRNVLNAVRQILDDEAEGKGVTLTMNHYIHAARPVTKAHVSNVNAFDSGEYGVLGYVDADRVVFYREPLRRQRLPLPEGDMPRVDQVMMYAGADGDYVRYAVEREVDGLVIQGFGWGNVNEQVYEAIGEVIEAGIPVVISTRVAHGRTQGVYGYPGGGRTLTDIGAIHADDLSPAKARILLTLALGETDDHDEIRAYFEE